MTKPLFPPKNDGDRMGCTDTARPEHFTNHQLSRVYDALRLLEETLGTEEAQKVWDALPRKVKTSFNYDKWEYRLPR